MKYKTNKKRDIRKIITLVCAILIVPVFLTFIFSLTLKETFINPQFYKNNIEKVDAYNRMVNEGIPSLIIELNITNDTLTSTFAKDLAVYIIKKAVDPAWIKSLTEKTIDKIVIFLSKPNQEVSLNLKDSQQFLTKVSDGLVIIEQLIPSCEQAQSNVGITKQLFNVSVNCGEMKVSLDDIKKDLRELKSEIDQVDLAIVNFEENVAKVNYFIKDIQKLIKNIEIFYWASLITLIILVLVIFLMQFRNIYLMLRSLSLSFAVGSLLGFIIGWIMKLRALKNLELVDFGLPSAMQSIITDIFKENILEAFHYLKLITVIVFAVSLLVYLCVLILEKYKVLQLIRQKKK